MDIWIYAAEQRDLRQTRKDVEAASCAYCGGGLRTPRDDTTYGKSDEFSHRLRLPFRQQRVVRYCPVCGWWYVREERVAGHPYRHHRIKGASGVLRNLDLSDQTLPLAEIRRHLAVRYGERFGIDPHRFEEVVASVYRDLGYDVAATGRTGDGGIDAVLTGPGGTIGVQVKRYKDAITAEQIREFTGALYLKGILSGIFVTTSSFTRGARGTAAQSVRANLPIGLVDAGRFYAQLGLAQRRAYEIIGDRTAPYWAAQMNLVNEYIAR